MPDAKPDSAYAEPSYAKPDAKVQLPWYMENIDKHLSPEMLEQYAGVPRDQQSAHVHKIRDQAWAIRTYPCTGLGVWLIPYISRSPAYPEVVRRLQAGETIVDIGCFVGMDLRRLVVDGAPSDRMYGVDIVSHWDVGYNLFHDRDRFAGHFIESDFLARDHAALNALLGRMDIISISAVLHQWTWAKQVEAATQLVRLATPKPGALVLGHQIGNVTAGEVVMPGVNVPTYRHDAASFARLWDEVGRATDSQWTTQAKLLTWADMGWDPADQKFMLDGDRVLDFVVTRVQ